MKVGYFHYGTFLSKWVVWIGETESHKDSQMVNPENCVVDHKKGTIEITNDGIISRWEFKPNSSIGDYVHKAFVREEEEMVGYILFTKVWITSEMTISMPTKFLKRTKHRSIEWFIKEYKRYIGKPYPSDIKTITSSTIDMMIRHHMYRHRDLDEYEVVPVFKTLDMIKHALGTINFTMDDVFL